MTEWLSLVDRVDNLKEDVRIALVGKYVELHDAYISVVESLKHAGYKHNAKVKIDWIQSEDIQKKMFMSILKMQTESLYQVALVIVELKVKLLLLNTHVKTKYHSSVFV